MKAAPKTIDHRLAFRHIVSKRDILQPWVLALVLLAFRQIAVAETKSPRRLSLVDIAYSNDDLDFTGPREASYYVPSDHQVIAPVKSESIFHTLLIEDDEGVLQKIKMMTSRWEEEQSFIEFWNLEDARIHAPLPLDEKKRFLEKSIVHYIDRRISGEIKKSHKRSTLRKVERLRKNLKPQTKFTFGQNYRIRVRSKVLRGLIHMKFENPYIDESLIKFRVFNKATIWKRESLGGEMKLHLKHRFDKSGPYSSQVEYGLNRESWRWEVRRELREVNPHIILRIQAVQEDRPALGRVFDKVGEVFYDVGF